MHELDTIIALSSAKGVGAIALIRLSGNKSIPIVEQFFSKKNLSILESHTIHFGTFSVGEDVIDEVVISLYKSPRSYTGEDIVEISCHGSSYIINNIIQYCIVAGARLAQAGEFTQRAFLHGKLDLSQAEAVADLIAAESKAAHDIALLQMRGGIAYQLKALRSSLIEFAALIELELDFAEEDVEFADRTSLIQLLQTTQKELRTMAESFRLGNAIKNGIPVAIVGKPNAGKSTLLNTLLQEDRAIVSSIAGTTRDTIEETLTIDGYLFRIIDTAGLRESNDEIEKIGIERSNAAIAKAEIIIYILGLDSTDNLSEVKEEISNVTAKAGNHKEIIIVGNKEDRSSPEIIQGWRNSLPKALIAISAKQHTGINELKKLLVAAVEQVNHTENAVIVTNQRHYEALMKAETAVSEVITNLHLGISSDLVTQDIKEALYYIGTITGDIDIDKDILGTIFGKFCVGK